MRMETNRLFLREMTPDDFFALYEVLADSDIMQHYPYTFDESRVHRWIDRNIERYESDGFGLWAVCLKENGKMIGDCGLTLQNINGQIKPEIGYHIAKAHQRRGYAKEAARFVRDWAFENTDFDILYSYMKATNLPSIATAKANGMILIEKYTDSEDEQTVVYGISRKNWAGDIRKMRNRTLVLYIHGKGGTAEEAEHYKPLFPHCDVVGLDYKAETPWEAKAEFSIAFEELTAKYSRVILIANSIGAYFSMCALPQEKIEKAYFISPIVDMEKLIGNMMLWANVPEDELREKGTIETAFGETLSWEYLCYVRSYPIHWTVPTEILYGGQDNLTNLETITAFANSHNASLTIMENGEHWFHMPEQMKFLDNWITAIRTDRLILRYWRKSDAQNLYEYAKDPDVGPIAGWKPHKSVEESRSIIQNVLSGTECYAICEKENDIAIGCIELRLNGHTDMTDCDDECELGYWLGKPFWGKGYMPEAANEILRHAFEDIGMTTVWCGYYDGNKKSKRVQEKLGFVYHHTCDNVPVPLMNEVRIGHTNVMTKEIWLKQQEKKEVRK